MKGVVLAGGRGERLRPLSRGSNKHLLQVHDRPMIARPLETLRQAGVDDVLIVTNRGDEDAFRALLGSGRKVGCRISYAVQNGAPGTATALLAARTFVGDDPFLAVAGDNVFGDNLGPDIRRFAAAHAGHTAAMILVRQVDNPSEFGVAVVREGRVVDLVEKPRDPPGSLVTTGAWLFRPEVFNELVAVTRSARGEYEITDVLTCYARQGRLAHRVLQSWWMDVGTPEALERAAKAFEDTQRRGIE